MSTTRLKAGDVVRLRSGGPAMTIEKLEDNTCYCMWREEGRFQWHTFSAEGLVLQKRAWHGEWVDA